MAANEARPGNSLVWRYYAQRNGFRLVAIAGALLAGVALASPSSASVTHTTGVVKIPAPSGDVSIDCDIWTWTDSSNQPRTVALKMEPTASNGNTGHGGYAVQMTYYRPVLARVKVGARFEEETVWEIVTVNAEMNATGIDANGDGGFGYFVSHERFRYFGNDANGNPILEPIAEYVFNVDDSPLGSGFAAASAIPLNTSAAGAESFTITYGHYGTIAPGSIDPSTGYDNPPLTANQANFQLYQIPVTTTWVFQDGLDFPRIDVSLDLSKVIPNGQTQPQADLVSFDVRGPYGVMVFDNGSDGPIESALWGDQQYTFSITSNPPVTRSSTWNWSGLNLGARYNGLTAGPGGTAGTFEMGLFEPLPASASVLADGYAAERSYTSTTYAAAVANNTASASVDACASRDVQTLPSDGTWPYQSMQYSLPCPPTPNFLTTPAYAKKLAWGSNAYYGTSLGQAYNGVQSYPTATWPTNHKVNYSVCLVLGWRGPTEFVKVPPRGLPVPPTILQGEASAYTTGTPTPANPDCATASVAAQ